MNATRDTVPGMKLTGWQATIVVSLVVIGAVTLAAMGRPLTDLIALVGLILGIGGGARVMGELQAVRENTNGNQSQLISIVRQAVTAGIISAQQNPDPVRSTSETVGTQGIRPKSTTD